MDSDSVNVLGMRACKQAIVYTFTKLHDKRIPTMYPNPDS